MSRCRNIIHSNCPKIDVVHASLPNERKMNEEKKATDKHLHNIQNACESNKVLGEGIIRDSVYNNNFSTILRNAVERHAHALNE